MHKLFKIVFSIYLHTKNLSAFSFRTDNSPIIKEIASKIMMLMQLLFCCHLFVFKMLDFDASQPKILFFNSLYLQTMVLFLFFYIWEQLPSISLLYDKFFQCFLKTNKPKNPTKHPPKSMLLDYLSSCPSLSHYYSCFKLIQRGDISCPMPEWLFEVEIFEGLICLHFFFVWKDPACGSVTVCGSNN